MNSIILLFIHTIVPLVWAHSENIKKIGLFIKR